MAKTAKSKLKKNSATKSGAKAAAKKSGAKSAAKSSAKAGAKTAKKAAAKPAAKTKKTLAKTPAKSAGKAAPKGQNKTPAKITAALTTKPKKTAKVNTDAIVGLFTPLDDRVLILRSVAMDRTPGGLYIPESASERPNEGQVVAVGRGHRDKKGRLRPLDVQLGDSVMFGGFSGSEIKIGEQEVFVVREKDIIAVVGT